MQFFKWLLSRFVLLFAEPLGLGGGGAMYWPAISPLDANVMFVACDMGGLYRTTDGGGRWTLLNQRQVRGAPAGPVVCDPNDVNVVLVWGQTAEPARTFLKRSTNRGDTWTALATPPAATKVTTLAVDRVPTTPGGGTYRLLSGTDAGPFYSDDLGQTWTAAPGTAGATVGIVVLPDPATGPFLYFLASGTAVYRSPDRGQTWQQVGGVPLAAIDSFSGAANGAFTPGVMLYATGGGSFTSSSDSGATWSAAQAGSYAFVGASDGNPHVVYAKSAYPQIVRKSSDRGQTWGDSLTNANPPLQNGWLEHDRGWGFGGGANGLAVSRTDANVAAVSNAGVVYRTTDGVAWRQVYSASSAASAPGQPWRSVGLEVTTTYFYDVDPADTQNHYISYTDIGFARSDDGGSRWYYSPPRNPWKNTPYNTIYEIAFDPATPGAFWAAASDVHDIPQPRYLQDVQVGGAWVARGSGGIVRWSGSAWADANAGLPQTQVARSWSDPSAGVINGVPPVVSIAVDPNNANRRWCSVFGDGVYGWDNAASQWVKRSNGLGFANNMNVYRLQYVDDRTVDGLLFCSVTARRDNAGNFLAQSGLFRSSDGGLNWVNVTATNASIRYAADYAVSPGDPNVIFLATINRPGADGALYRTLDAMSNAPQWAVVFDINSVPQTPIGRLHWPYLGCFSVTIDAALKRTVFLCTLTHGTWISTAGGDPGTWREFQAIPFLPTHRLFIRAVSSSWFGTNETLYITTFGAGVWKVGLEWRFWRWFCRWPWWSWPRRWWPCWPWYWLRPIPWWLKRTPLPWPPPKRQIADPRERIATRD